MTQEELFKIVNDFPKAIDVINKKDDDYIKAIIIDRSFSNYTIDGESCNAGILRLSNKKIELVGYIKDDKTLLEIDKYLVKPDYIMGLSNNVMGYYNGIPFIIRY